jgi:peroxiredoxin (alkyl hydroperoxide reductase subunit C)
MLSDLNRDLSRVFGVLNSTGSVALRAQVLIDPRGIVRHLSINDLGIGRSVDESLRLVQAVKFVDEHGGEACPVNWKPGKASMKADPEGSKQYFLKG